MNIKRKTLFLNIIIYLLFFNIIQTYSNDTVKSTVKDIFIEFELKKNQDNRKNALQQSYLIGLERYLDWVTVSSKSSLASYLLVPSIVSTPLISEGPLALKVPDVAINKVPSIK